MEFAPPANAQVITQADIEKMTPVELEEPDRLPHYILRGPVFIKGGISGKNLRVSGGGLWIEGKVEDCNIEVVSDGTSEVLHLMDTLRDGALVDSAKEIVDRLRLKAADDGLGLYIKGNVVDCEGFAAPNISITGDVQCGSREPVDGEHPTYPNHFHAIGGNLHIHGSIKGQVLTQQQSAETLREAAAKRAAQAASGKVKRKDAPTSFTSSSNDPYKIAFNQLDQLTATGNVVVSGAVEGVGLETEGGIITTGTISGQTMKNTKGWISDVSPPKHATARGA